MCHVCYKKLGIGSEYLRQSGSGREEFWRNEAGPKIGC